MPMDFYFPHDGQWFVWDIEKALKNLHKHGVSFEIACQVLLDPLMQIEDASGGLERREAAIGETEDQKLLYVVHIAREEAWIRILSARKATAHERRRYEDNQ